jgi:predicted Fe-Mo cluster-binding NifX family protein
MTPKELIAVPTEGDRGIKDRVSGIFAKSPYFTFVEVIDKKRGEISVQKNEASKLAQGTGPIVMKNLKDRGVDVVLAGDVGPGAKTLMEISGIRLWKTEAGTKVSKAVSLYIDSQA